MNKVLFPAAETARLAELASYNVLDTAPEQTFDDVVNLASQVFEAPMALIALIDQNRLWFKSRKGLDTQWREATRENSPCAYTLWDQGEVLIVPDAKLDHRFATSAMVTEYPRLRYCCAAPLISPLGHLLGTVCALDPQPRARTTADQAMALASLARYTTSLLEYRKLNRQMLHAQEAARRSRDELELLSVFSSLNQELKSYIDCDYTYRYVNQLFLDYCKLPEESVIGCNVEQVWGSAIFANKIKPWLDLALSGESSCDSAVIGFPGRGLRQVEVQYLPVRRNDGSVKGAVVRTQDVHDLYEQRECLKQTAELLEKKTLAQEKFIHVLSHDLTEPLNTIINFSSLIVDTPVDRIPPEVDRYARLVHGGGLRMKNLLQDLLTYVRLEKVEFVKQRVNFSRVMEDVSQDLNDTISRARAVLWWDDLPTVSGEQSLLRVLCQNLISNAIKFKRANIVPHINVIARKIESEANWEICFQDNGIGIPSTSLEAVFEQFKRLHTRKQFEGTGLGLSTCKRIAELHGGSLRVESQVGVGSCFILTLPQFLPNQ